MIQREEEVKRSNAAIAKLIADQYNIGFSTVTAILKRADELRFEELVKGTPVNYYGIVTVTPHIINDKVTIRSRTSSTLVERIEAHIASRGVGV